MAHETPDTRAAVIADLKTLLRGFDEGVFVRSIDGDARPDWGIKLLPYLSAMARLHTFIQQPEADRLAALDARAEPGRDPLAAPCQFCSYSGPNYWQAGTHASGCRWYGVGGEAARRASLAQSAIAAAPLAAPAPQHDPCYSCRGDKWRPGDKGHPPHAVPGCRCYGRCDDPECCEPEDEIGARAIPPHDRTWDEKGTNAP